MALGSRTYLLIFVFVLAPIAAAVVISVLLLFHVTPHTVFAPGFALQSALASAGVHVQKQWMVLSTAFTYWLVIVAVGLLLTSRTPRPPS